MNEQNALDKRKLRAELLGPSIGVSVLWLAAWMAVYTFGKATDK